MNCLCPTHGPSSTNEDFPVGVVIPLQGPAGIFGPSCEAVTEVAVAEVNAGGGILGRAVRPITIDGGAPPAEVAAVVRSLVHSGTIHAVTGWHISQVRQHLVPVVTGHIPYVYTSLYEGGESAIGVFCSGETPPDQIAPAFGWMRAELGMRRVYLVGDDYVWPRGTARAVHSYARRLGVGMVGETFVPLGTHDFTAVLTHIASTRPDTVLMLLVGQDAVHFNRAFAASGLHTSIRRLSPLMEETMLLGSGPESTHGLFVAAAYFRSLATASAMELTSAYGRMHGPTAPALNNMAESCFEGIMALAALTRRAGTLRPEGLTAVSDQVGYDGPRGAMQISRGHVRQPVYLAHAEGTSFDIITRL